MNTPHVQKRNVAIDFVKVIATLLVLNSHMEICYGKYSILATGGAFGDALFFFVSGFALFLGRKSNFVDWYKRRLGRIYPTVIAAALVGCLIFGSQQNFIQVITAEKYWFLQCILVCYILMYPIVRYDLNLKIIFPISIIICVISYFCFYHLDGLFFYGEDNTFRWLVFFSIMLLGGAAYKYLQNIPASRFAIIGCLLCAIMWYLINYVANCSPLQLVSFIPLCGFCLFVYQIGKSRFIEKCFSNKVVGNILYITGNLCLESYLIQEFIFTDSLNHLFPLNIPIIMLCVLIASYLLHILSETISQIFDSKPLDWRRLFLRKPF